MTQCETTWVSLRDFKSELEHSLPKPLEVSGTRGRILEAAVKLFASRGLASTTVRDLGEAVGIKSPALYNHFTSKEEILGEAMLHALNHFWRMVVVPLDDAPEEKWLELLVRRHILYQIQHADTAAANDSLLNFHVIVRALPEAYSTKVMDLHSSYFEFARALCERSAPTEYEIDLSIVTFAILAMCDRAAVWYRPDGGLSPEEVADYGWQLVQKMLSSSAST